MGAVWMNSGLLQNLKIITGGEVTARYGTLKLFVNNITPDPADIQSTYTELSGVSGYSAKDFISLSWGYSATGGIARALAAPIIYTFGAYVGTPKIVYGIFVTNNLDAASMFFAERFDTPFTINNAGDVLTVYPAMSDRKLP